jgi:hypothetical protein
MQIAGLPEQNPLKKYFRQPKLYITLPSKGQYYTEGSIQMTETGEIPVYAMTAKDELTMKTPDALLNGQATVELIQSCVPNIKDAWKMPSIDLDLILIAIRIATYGENLDITTKVPNTGKEKEYTVDLRKILQQLSAANYDNYIQVNAMKVYLRPLTYKEFTDASLKTFEEQRIFRLVNDQNIPDNEKLARFSESFSKLTKLTVGMIANSIAKIVVDDTEVTERKFIKDFIDNADKEFYNEITEHLELQKEKFQIKPLRAVSEPEEIAEGAPEQFDVPITFDQSNFFG